MESNPEGATRNQSPIAYNGAYSELENALVLIPADGIDTFDLPGPKQGKRPSSYARRSMIPFAFSACRACAEFSGCPRFVFWGSTADARPVREVLCLGINLPGSPVSE